MRGGQSGQLRWSWSGREPHHDDDTEGAMTLQLRGDDLDWSEIDGEIVALDGRDARYLTVNGSGALLWRMLAVRATRQELVSALLASYDLDEAIATRDTDSFLQSLSEQGLLAA
jgi:hypothetical protein